MTFVATLCSSRNVCVRSPEFLTFLAITMNWFALAVRIHLVPVSLILFVVFLSTFGRHFILVESSLSSVILMSTVNVAITASCMHHCVIYNDLFRSTVVSS